ncbi:MAG: hypothetical protein AAF413_01660 [Patescibacteria group bacterium]
MCTICPTITASDPHAYRAEMEVASRLSDRVHIDFMDSDFTGVTSINLIQAWMPEDVQVDLHIMYKNPTEHIETIVSMRPDLAIVHAEADGDLAAMMDELHGFGIDVGVALLPETEPANVKELIQKSDHVLIFGGKLGHHGGTAQLELLHKVDEIKQINPDAEIAWDGGVNARNAGQIKSAGVIVLNVGGAIQHADDPDAAYKELIELVS